MAVMKDVAKLAGVSISTVSFVLNGTAKEHKVADKTAQKVLLSLIHISEPTRPY